MVKDTQDRSSKSKQIHKKPERDYKTPRSRPKYQNQRNSRSKQSSFLSVVIPLYNEEESLPELSLHLQEEMEKLSNKNYEVIFVDDGSTDRSFLVIKEIIKRNNKFKAIRFRRNYGKSAALSVGFKQAKGNIIITMDADMQDDPSEIKNLVSKIKAGSDLVTGWKKKRKDPLSKTLPSKFFNFVTSIVSGIKLHDFNCGLKAYRKEVVDSLQVYGEMHRYLPALAYLDGFKVTETPVVHHARLYGKSKFGASRFLKGFLDLLTVMFITRFMKRPSHFFGGMGSLFAITGLVIDSILSIQWAMGLTSLSNRPLALLGIALIIVGVQLISMGLIGELILKNNFQNVQYNIKERL